MTGEIQRAGKKIVPKLSSRLIKVLNDKVNRKQNTNLNMINIRNRNMRIRMNTTITPQKIEQMKMFLCLNKNSLSKLREKQKQILKEFGSSSSYSYRQPNASMILDLANNKSKIQPKNQVDFLKWQMNRLGSVGRSSNVDNLNLNTSLGTFNGSDIISVIEKLNNAKSHTIETSIDTNKWINQNSNFAQAPNIVPQKSPTPIHVKETTKTSTISSLFDNVYKNSRSDFHFKSPIKL